MELKAHKVLKDLLAMMELKARKVLKDLLEMMELKDLRVHRAFKVSLVLLVTMD